MLPTRVPVPLIASKGFRYNRRDIAIDQRFEAVSPQDADILVKARLARKPPEEPATASTPAAAAATTAADSGARSPTAPNVAAAIRPGAPVRVRAPRPPRKKTTGAAGQGVEASTAKKP